jgi:hypothetical protein
MNEALDATTASATKRMAIQPGPGSLQLVTTGDLAGSWTVKASNKPGADVTQDTNAADITAGFAPVSDDDGSIQDSDGSTAAKQKQYVQMSLLAAGSIEVTFTRSGGSGNALVHVNN